MKEDTNNKVYAKDCENRRANATNKGFNMESEEVKQGANQWAKLNIEAREKRCVKVHF